MNSVHNYVIIMILCNDNIYIAIGHEDRSYNTEQRECWERVECWGAGSAAGHGSACSEVR